MAKYRVRYIQYHDYEIEADTEYEARGIADDQFDTDMHRPVANSWYDDVEIEEIEAEE